MGCRCCKMIKSYIFDPEEAQSSGYINEINRYKQDDQNSNKFICKQNSEIQVPKTKLQNDDIKRIENKNRLNSTKDALWNPGGPALQEDELGNYVANSGVAVNGVKTSTHGNSTQQEESSSANTTRDLYTRGLSQPNKPGKEQNIFLTESAILETQNDAIQLADLDYTQNSSQTSHYYDVKNDIFLDKCTHSDEKADSVGINKEKDLSLSVHVKDSCASLDKAMKTESVNVYFPEDMPDGNISVSFMRAAREAKNINCEEVNGEIEEEDAEVAEALAALEAATAGEDFEEDDEY
uniref:Chromosome 4 open reading frame 19 n=1 Tax=Crocodylus porosus TaxID=8502 RepID=A0A7M4ECT3_CROPO